MGNGHIKKSTLFFGILAGCALISALLLPYVYALLVSKGLSFDIHRVFSRIFLILSFAGLAVLYKRLDFAGILSSQWKKRKKISRFLKGFSLGLFIILLLTAGALLSGVRIFSIPENIITVTQGFFSSLITGVVVGILVVGALGSFLFNYIF